MSRWIKNNTGTLVVSLLLLLLLIARWQYFLTACPRNGDYALLALQTELASNFDLLVGPYSRFGFNHPLPTYSYYYALFHIITGDFFSWMGTLQVAVFVLNAICLIFTVRLLALAGMAAHQQTLFSLIMLIGVHLYHRGSLINIWGPATMVAPLLLLSVAFAVLALNHSKVLPYVVFAALLLVSNHLVGIVLCIGTFAAMLVCLWLGARSTSDSSEPVKLAERVGLFLTQIKELVFAIGRLGVWPKLLVIVLLLAAVVPVVGDYLQAGQSANLYRILSYSNKGDPYTGISTALTTFLDLHRYGSEYLLAQNGLLIVAFLILVMSWRKWSSLQRNLFIMLLGGMLTTIYFIASIRGAVLPYLLWFYDSYRILLLYLLLAAPFDWLSNKVSDSKIRYALSSSVLGIAAVFLYSTLKREAPNSCDYSVQEFVEAKLKPGKFYQIIVHGQKVPANTGLLAYYLLKADQPFCVRSNYPFLFGASLSCADQDQASVDGTIRIRKLKRNEVPEKTPTILIEDEALWFEEN